jgi:hypothetical protein
MRRFIVFVIVLGVLLFVTDRVVCGVAQRQIAAKIQSTEGLAERPSVKVHGFPFLTQALGGRYQRIDADAADLSVQDGVSVDTLHVELRGVQVKLGDVMGGQVPATPVDSAVATATMGYPSLDEVAKANLPDQALTVKFGPGEAQGQSNLLAVTGDYRGSGLKLQFQAQARVAVRNGKLVVSLLPSTLESLPRPVRTQLVALVGDGYQIPPLPFGFKAKSLTVGPTAITFQATATSVRLS